MNRRNFLKNCVLSLGTVAFTGCKASATGLNLKNNSVSLAIGKRKPNIIFFLVDDMGWRDCGFMGSKYYETPNMDKLASQGMIFTNAYANAANCAPTRACFLSGKFPMTHGIYTVGSSSRGKSNTRRLIPVTNNDTLATSHTTIAEALKPAGYTSLSIGKWHMGTNEYSPTGQGFDYNVAGNETGSPKGGYFSPYNNPQLPDGPDGEYLPDRLTDEAIKFIDKHKEKPFFLYFPHYSVHTPIQAKDDLKAKYQAKTGDENHFNPTYAAMLDSTDQSLGRIMNRLKELKLTENTIIIFSSDNGGYGPATLMKPLRGSKGMPYEGGIREPTVIAWPGKIKPGTKCDTPIQTFDFYPTILDLASTRKPADKKLDGVSLWPLLQGKTIDREAIYWHSPVYLQKYSGNMEDARDPLFRTRPVSIIRKGDFKLLMFFEEWLLDGGREAIATNNSVELYDLKNDIGETNNLVNNPSYIANRDELLDQLLAWQETNNAPNKITDMPKNPDYVG
ncbi:MAG: sulfatase [Phycisphaerae bacterium]|nr:sulfatase [Phycisphaerae bacterium]